MGTGGVKDKEVFGSSLRRWTGSTGVAKLVAESKILKWVLIEKLAIPLLTSVQLISSHHMTLYKRQLTSTRCRGRDWWSAIIHSTHLSILLLGQSMHLKCNRYPVLGMFLYNFPLGNVARHTFLLDGLLLVWSYYFQQYLLTKYYDATRTTCFCLHMYQISFLQPNHHCVHSALGLSVVPLSTQSQVSDLVILECWILSLEVFGNSF